MSDREAAAAARAKTALLWIVTIVGAAGIGVAGASKFTATDMWNGLFTEWGYPLWFKTVIGMAEVAGAIFVLIPRFATYAATLVCAIMLGAIYTVAMNQSDLGFIANTGNLIIFAIIAYARRDDRWMAGR